MTNPYPLDHKPSNPPAFPCNGVGGMPHSGMTLRDWFAGMALQGIVAGKLHTTLLMQATKDPEHINKGELCYPLADWAYVLADAMLAEREKGTNK